MYKVNHALFLDKLLHFKIEGNLHDWFRSYLVGRRQRVTVFGATSQELPVTSGVPQGSLLGPVLFLLSVNDLLVVSTSSDVAGYADNTKSFRRVATTENCAALQSDLTNVDEWSESSDLLFNRSEIGS